MIDLAFRDYGKDDESACLAIFDGNCPEFFAPNEREDYRAFLGASPKGYEVCLSAGDVVGAFGVFPQLDGAPSLNWILLHPNAQGLGLGSAIMARSSASARALEAAFLRIAASHKSAPFFEKFGAQRKRFTKHGWGRDMHRVDMELPIER
ncbi:MAG: GNAT family N-acetyltransferase [Pseudomonadota bacterium]